MNSIRHWVGTNTSLPRWIELPKPQAAAPKKRKMNPMYRFGPKAKPIHHEGRVYTTWQEACDATGKTKDAIRHAIKMAKRPAVAPQEQIGDGGSAFKKIGRKMCHKWGYMDPEVES